MSLLLDAAPAPVDDDVLLVPAPPPSLLRRFTRSRALGWVVVALLLAWWQWTATANPSPQLPSLSAIFTEWRHEMFGGPLWPALTDTLSVMVRGYLIACVLGTLLGLLMARVRVLYALLEPLLELLRPIPIAAYIPLVIFYLGIGASMKIYVVVVASLFPVLLNAYAGASSVTPTMLDTARTFRLGWFQTMREVVLPAAAPSIFVGYRVALSASLIVAVVTGMIAGNSGVGYYLLLAQQMMDVTKIFAGALTVAFVGYALNSAFLLVERFLLHWHVSSSRTR